MSSSSGYYQTIGSHERDERSFISSPPSTSPLPLPLPPPPSVAVDRGCLGWRVIHELNRDAWLLIGSKAVRLYSYGYLAVMLMIYLQTLDFSDSSIGLLFTSTLFGDAIVSIFLTSHADHSFGRRNTLMIGSFLAISTSFVFAYSRNFFVLLFAGILGVISPSGSEIGPFMAIELSSLSQVSTDSQRTHLMAWYNLFGSLSSALGALSCGLIINHLVNSGYDLQQAGNSVLLIYGSIQIVQFVMFCFLSPEIEVPVRIMPHTVGRLHDNNSFLGLHKSKWVVLKLSMLFMLDSFAGSFVLQSIMSAWFYDTYDTSSTVLGSIVFNCNIAAGVSALFAAQLAGYIGLVMTMVVTHLPSNVLLILVPIMPSERSAIVMLCLRYTISQMDVPTRNAYVQGVVDPDERSAANGITNVVRSIGASIGPYLCGLLLSNPLHRNYPFYIAGGLKIIYDLLLLWNFSAMKSTSDTHLLTTHKAESKSEEQIELIVKQ